MSLGWFLASRFSLVACQLCLVTQTGSHIQPKLHQFPSSLPNHHTSSTSLPVGSPTPSWPLTYLRTRYQSPSKERKSHTPKQIGTNVPSPYFATITTLRRRSTKRCVTKRWVVCALAARTLRPFSQHPLSLLCVCSRLVDQFRYNGCTKRDRIRTNTNKYYEFGCRVCFRIPLYYTTFVLYYLPQPEPTNFLLY